MEIKNYKDNPLLRKECKEVTDFQATKPIIKEMFKILDDTTNGIGLAASQIEKDLQLAIIDVPDFKGEIINPVITKRNPRMQTMKEGCLSIEGEEFWVERNRKVTVKYLDSSGKKHKLIASGILAKAIQHEVDHLNGILCKNKSN